MGVCLSVDRRYIVDWMTTNAQDADGLTPQVRDVLGAYLDASMLTESLQAELWREKHLTLSQLLVLRSLRDGGVQLAGHLAEAAGLSPASATRVVDRLEERGLVRRQRDRDDRRCVLVQLTAEGRHLLGTVRVLHDSPLRHAVEAMSVSEQRSLAAALHRLARRARQLEHLTPRVATVAS
jgi:DNA-binding MarR family transcriptional regulator